MDLTPRQREDLRNTLSEVTHAVNNPLSIISGNAQLLRVLAQSEGLGDDFVQPIHDIEEASDRLSQLMGRLTELRERLRRDAGTAASAAEGGAEPAE